MSWFQVPLSHGAVAIRERNSASLALGCTLTSPCNANLIRAQRMMIRVPGASLAARTVTQSSQLERRYEELVGIVTSLHRSRPTAVAISSPRQSDREHYVALAMTDTGPLFVKVSSDPQAVRQEQAVLECLDGRCGPFRVPRALGSGSTGQRSWIATESLPIGRHTPVYEADIAEVSRVLQRCRLAVDGTATDAIAHRDLSPWNARNCNGELWLVDWSDTDVAPSGSDELYFLCASSSLGHPLPIPLPAFSKEAFESVHLLIEHRLARSDNLRDRAMREVLNTISEKGSER